jgi:hypothetical protein
VGRVRIEGSIVKAITGHLAMLGTTTRRILVLIALPPASRPATRSALTTSRFASLLTKRKQPWEKKAGARKYRARVLIEWDAKGHCRSATRARGELVRLFQTEQILISQEARGCN